MLTGAMGAINVLSAVTPALRERLAVLGRFLPIATRHGARLSVALAGFALFVVSANLWRRKRMAWWLAMGLLVFSAATHLLKGFDYEEASIALFLAFWLFMLRSQFFARSDAPSVWQGLRALAGAFVFTLAYGAAGFFTLDRHFSINFDLWQALRQTAIMFTQFYDPGLEPITRFGRFFTSSIYAVAAVTFAYALIMLFRPVLLRKGSSLHERKRARDIVEEYGRTDLARFALLPDKAYYFSSGGSVMAFVVKNRIALALGDPIGPETDVKRAIVEFVEFCGQNDWGAAFHNVPPDYLPIYEAAGFLKVCIGHDPIVDLGRFTLTGKGNQNLRTALNRMKRAGISAEVLDPPLSDDMVRQLREVSNEWLSLVKGVEKGYSLGWFDDDYIRESRVIIARAPEGSIDAFANLIPEYHKPELTVDLMRHRRNAEKGIMDFLFVELLEWAKQHGYESFSLGLSSLAGVGETPEDPVVERALHYIYEHLNQFYSFKGLHAFKKKFKPHWEPRYLVFPGWTNLPSVAAALIRADSGDGFLVGYLKGLLMKAKKG